MSPRRLHAQVGCSEKGLESFKPGRLLTAEAPTVREWQRDEEGRLIDMKSIATCVSVPLLLHNVAANVAEIKGMCCGQPLGHVSFSQHCVGS